MVNVLICTVREVHNPEVRFCFELISPYSRPYVLQAESEEEMKDWMQVFHNCTESLLANQEHQQQKHVRHMSIASKQRYNDETTLLVHAVRTVNKHCVDCGTAGKMKHENMKIKNMKNAKIQNS